MKDMEKDMENKMTGSKRKGHPIRIIILITLLVLFGSVATVTYLGLKAAGDLLIQTLSEPLDGATSATVTLDQGDGNLTLEKNAENEPMLASGTLQYYEKIGVPLSSHTTNNGAATYTLNAGGGQPWFQLPWSVCNGGSEWLIRLNPTVSYDVTAFTGGGNIKIDLTGLTVTRLEAETGGGNMEITMPDHAANLDVYAKTGAGKVIIDAGSILTGHNTLNANSGAGEVTVILPKDVAVRVNVSQGNVTVDPTLLKIDDTTYETANYQNASDRVDITAGSGAGKVSVVIG